MDKQSGWMRTSAMAKRTSVRRLTIHRSASVATSRSEYQKYTALELLNQLSNSAMNFSCNGVVRHVQPRIQSPLRFAFLGIIHERIGRSDSYTLPLRVQLSLKRRHLNDFSWTFLQSMNKVCNSGYYFPLGTLRFQKCILFRLNLRSRLESTVECKVLIQLRSIELVL